MNLSPTHPEMDTLGPNRATPSAPPTQMQKLYSTNPYWKRSGNVPESPEPVSAPPEELLTEKEPALPAHLIAALTAAIEKAHQVQGEQLTRQLTAYLLTMPQQLTPTVEQYLAKSLPKVVKVEQPGQTLLKLVRYLTVGMVVAGLVIGGLLFTWLQTRQQRDLYANGYWQHRYLLAKATVDRSATLTRLLRETDTLHHSPTFSSELTRLEKIIEARQQQYQLHLQEQALVRKR